jgi:predicted esterase YcpF (UPF0227 family)
MTNNKQQTAVEQFAIALYENGFLTGNGDEIQELLEKAKEMEKEQHRVTAEDFYYGSHSFKNFEQYYKETYEKQ